MRLGVRMLQNVTSVNAWDWASQVEATQGDTFDVYFQLVDLTRDTPVQGFKPSGRRFVPEAGATMSVRLDNIDDAVALTRAATQPYAQDPSIWKFSVLATDTIRGTCALQITLTEPTGTKKTYARVEAVVAIKAKGAL